MGVVQGEQAAALVPVPERAAGNVPAVLLVSDADTRLLLKGLLRLHRHPVTAEMSAIDELEALPPVPQPTILLVESDPAAGGWEAEVPLALRRHPLLRPVVIASERSPEIERRARAIGVRAIIARPFSIRELTGAIDAAAEDIEPAGPLPV
jgi:CheY-like chemotaxis protein